MKGVKDKDQKDKGASSAQAPRVKKLLKDKEDLKKALLLKLILEKPKYH